MIDIYIEYANKYIENGTLNIPKDFINDQNSVLEMNDEVKLWIEEDFEFNPEYKFSKYELEQTKIFKRLGLKRITDDLKRLGYKYVKDLRKDGKKGLWVGLRLIENETLIWSIFVKTVASAPAGAGFLFSFKYYIN